MKGAEELGRAGKDSGKVGRHNKGLGDVFQGGGAGGSFIWVGDVGADTLHGTGPGEIPSQGCQADNREASEAMVGLGMGATIAGDRDGGGGF